MSYSSRLKIFFIGCVGAFTLAAWLVFALLISLCGPLGGLADFADELSLLIALLAASRLTGRLKNYHARRTVMRIHEAGWLKWTSELAAQKSAASAPLAVTFRKVA